MKQEMNLIAEFFIPVHCHSGYRQGRKRLDFAWKALPYIPSLPINHTDRYEIHVDFYSGGDFRNDIDNSLKCLLDAIKGKAIYDDWNVKKLRAEVHEGTDKTGVNVKILRLKSYTHMTK